ncbi:Uncharacterized ACR, COG1399 [Actinomyces bovis]|uniref:Uncharacterized ACR, COG1399 n=1 Tax=Actinomyces bovis TaxID=1658 RepID=A0ABY1VKG9_9ACTO|nr:DUF177 domain-containing protein [Actinomyces bovis]SPT52585.1 Uncharacterized ACR, COG1399 [Actinomyces bovis]VEG54384.1 Uncharacterized ACR, COG1399 [Actinomyces israelii]
MDGLVIDIVDLPRQIGSFKDVHLELPAPEGLGTEIIGAQPGTPLKVDAALTSTEDGVLVRASARAHIHGECVRCLADIDEDQNLSFDELYLLPEVAASQHQEDEDEGEEIFVLGEFTLDLEPALRDALVGSLPFQPLCDPDCPGLCQDCGERLADLPEDHQHESLDPRWAALSGLLQEVPRAAQQPANPEEQA